MRCADVDDCDSFSEGQTFHNYQQLLFICSLFLHLPSSRFTCTYSLFARFFFVVVIFYMISFSSVCLSFVIRLICVSSSSGLWSLYIICVSMCLLHMYAWFCYLLACFPCLGLLWLYMWLLVVHIRGSTLQYNKLIAGMFATVVWGSDCCWVRQQRRITRQHTLVGSGQIVGISGLNSWYIWINNRYLWIK